MVISLFKSNKSIIEKLRMIYYRLKKYIYIFITRNNKYNPSISLNYINKYESYISKNMINAYFSSYKNEVIKEADLLINNIYEDISGQKINVGNEIDWNYDYVFNYKWEKKHYYSYILKNKNISTDIKHVWEFSRFYHLVILGQAYVITGSEKYVKKIIDDIMSWEMQNPFNYSVNWTVSMEVAIRAVNLIQSIDLIRDSELLEPNTIDRMNNLIYKHAIYIWNNLEKGINTNNHYLSNLIGLIWISIYFNKTDDAKLKRKSCKWLRFSLKQLEHELEYQIYDDGFSYEDSISYHCLNLEMLLLTLDVLKKNRIDYPEFLYDVTKKMTIALNKVLINNTIPVIGDMDNGRLMKVDIVANRDKTNFGYLILIANDVFINNIENVKSSPITFPNAGIYRIFNNTFDTIIRCGNIGVNGIGGHSHNDQLSFVMYINNQNFFIDPGTGYYSGNYELRNRLRSTQSHNTLYIDGYEQNDISLDLFKMKGKTKAELIKISKDSFEGKHYGYMESLGVGYNRRIDLFDDRIEIIDTLSKLPSQRCYLNFVLDSDVTVTKVETKLILEKNKERVVLNVDGGEITIKNNQPLSKSYGHFIKTIKIQILPSRPEVKTTIEVMACNK